MTDEQKWNEMINLQAEELFPMPKVDQNKPAIWWANEAYPVDISRKIFNSGAKFAEQNAHMMPKVQKLLHTLKEMGNEMFLVKLNNPVKIMALKTMHDEALAQFEEK